MVVVWRNRQARSVMVEANCLQAGYKVCKDPQPRVVLEFGEGCVYGHELSAHDGAHLFASCGVDVYGGAGWDVYHRGPQPRLVLDV